MNLVFTIFLIIHILSGTLGLVCGTLNMIRIKGNQAHKQIGKLFYTGMLASSCSALVLSILHPNYFLFSVGIFTFYMTISGKRYLHFKQVDHQAQGIDWIVSYGMLVTALVFVVAGIVHLINSQVFGLVFMLFGYLALRFFRADVSNYKGNSKIENFWLTCHLQRMIGAYIASLTAFLVVNHKWMPGFVPGILVWMLPTFSIVPFIIKWSKLYKKEKENAN